ncbi:hypothetical protein BGZ57DRAFT_1007784 [Hyaloscypha finlandica]|nr:hypothetical protein BGZ57DRAFT_1007784 [Hyaloscypha finlandica]
MTPCSNSTSLPEKHLSSNPDTIHPYLQKALNHPDLVGAVALFNPSPSPPTTWPRLLPSTTNQILLYPGSFNPPHSGHLATIQYFADRRALLTTVAFFIFCDPSSVILTKNKKHNSIILPRSLRNTIFYQTPELTQLISEGWLHLLVGSMESHISYLRILTDSINGDGWRVKLVGFLGGDKLSAESPPHLPPGELTAWGPVDEFLIINARRPVDFYTPRADTKPRDLPGCTAWEREEGGGETELGIPWVCRALTVPGEPLIRFRASQRSASNGVSSTDVRRIMCGVPDERLYEHLKEHVLGCGLLVDCLEKYRGKKGEGGQQGE